LLSAGLEVNKDGFVDRDLAQAEQEKQAPRPGTWELLAECHLLVSFPLLRNITTIAVALNQRIAWQTFFRSERSMLQFGVGPELQLLRPSDSATPASWNQVCGGA